MNKNISTLLAILVMASASAQVNNPARYVDPFIGTDFHGHTYPGATVPFGMVQLSPDTRLTGWDGCSGYHYSDSVVYGFSHTHLSGTGCSDYGDILLIPTVGKPQLDNKLYASPFRKETEEARAGYYSVFLDKYNVKADLTATARVGFHRYKYPKTNEANVILDLEHRDKVLESWIQVVGNNEIRGFRRSKEWAADQHVYFVIRFSSSFVLGEVHTADGSPMTVNLDGAVPGRNEGKNLKAWFNFPNLKGKELLVKVALSGVSVEGALKNMEAELPGWDFDKTAKEAYNLWNKELSKIAVEGGTKEQMTTFYSALYHCMVVPNLYSDVDGMYRGMDQKIYKAEGFTPYTVFSLWDTYRAWNPLMTIINARRTNDFINTFLSHYKTGGLLPVWELSANETFCMIGYHSVPVIVDAWMKGIRDFDSGLALEAMKHSSNLDHHGLKAYRKYGFIPGDLEHESVSKTLEYAYDDWCIAQFAKSLGKESDYSKYIGRAQYYKNIFDPSTGYMRPRLNGGWKANFNPAEVDNNFTEANSWQYSFYVPQDVAGLIALHGGADKFEKKLDDLFNAKSDLAGKHQSDITGLIGQYAHGNEPSHHMAYLYNYVGKPWKTQKIVRRIVDEMYNEKPDGLCGNEDCGQMSAWYVMSTLGFYPVCPGSTQYVIGSPLFGKAQVSLENGKKFTVITENNSKQNIYITEAYLNGKPLKRSWIDHSDILSGGELRLVMGPQPNRSWGSNTDDSPKSAITENLIVRVPHFTYSEKTFTDSITQNIVAADPSHQVFYAFADYSYTEEPTTWTKGSPVILSKTGKLYAYAETPGGQKSKTVEGKFIQVDLNKKIAIKSKYSQNYSAGGDIALIDQVRGEANFRLGGWQGYQGQDFEAVIDLGAVKPISYLGAGFLQDAGSWIMMPRSVAFFASVDGTTFSPVLEVVKTLPDTEMTPTVQELGGAVNTPAQFIKIVAKGFGPLPEWHSGKGNPSWLFIDEVVVR
jgi:predicted alpha-1,2-mannosidase